MEKISRKPDSVILFDKIENVHPGVLQILRQVLEDGQITDSQGRKVDFKNTLVIMTSNVGAEILQKDITLGFVADQTPNQSFEKPKMAIIDEAKNIQT
jgi:ATP-dependent Clp protease ATP-binding subunit ClpC